MDFRDHNRRRKHAADAHSPPQSSSKQAKSVSTVVKADIYPEFGTYPGGGESPIIPFDSEKNAEREVIHGRWAMLGVTGAWAAENGTGIPWFTAGTLCTPDDCTAVADKLTTLIGVKVSNLYSELNVANVNSAHSVAAL